jgi:hypothetical protein
MFTYNGNETLVYPNIKVDGKVLVAEPGKSYNVETAPDARWSAVAPTQTAPPVTPPEASAPDTTSTPTTN